MAEEQLNFSSLFGDEFNIEIKTPTVKEIKTKLEKAKSSEVPVEKLLKSKKVSLEERLAIIKSNVLQILGKQKDNVLVITSRQQFTEYIDKAIEVGRIAIDTETNNSLDPITCKIAGLCLYIPNEKQVYIPVNHRNSETKLRLENQCTEQDIKEELQRLVDHNVFTVFHNYKFDYEVIKCTCNIEIPCSWDTQICARLLDENNPSGLKYLYTAKIDPTQSKYDIESLFENVSYLDVSPDIFALYAATDSMMTDKLYELQEKELSKPEYDEHFDLTGKHKVKGLRWLFHNVEVPIARVTAEMELAGVMVDSDFGDRLRSKYNFQLEQLDEEINQNLQNLDQIISAWRLTPEANQKSVSYVPKKTSMTAEKIEQQYPEIDDKGQRFKYGKPKTEILEKDINLSSPTQLAILFYDILEVPSKSRKTGKDDLDEIKEKLSGYLDKVEDEEIDFDEDLEEVLEVSEDKIKAFKLGCAAKLANLLLKRRKISKLITTYLDTIPVLAKHWPDGRIRFHLNSLGTDTGRYSSGGKIKYMNENDEPVIVSGINIQNIPSRGDGKITRMLFKATTKYHSVEITDNYFEIPETDEVETINGWKSVINLTIGDTIIGNSTTNIITDIKKFDKVYRLYC